MAQNVVSGLTPPNVTRLARTATSPGPSATNSRPTLPMLLVAVWSARELPRDTLTATLVVTTTLASVVMIVLTADGAGLRMMQPSGPQLKVYVVASPLRPSLALVETATASTIAVVGPTVLLATGLGPQTTRPSGTRKMLTAAARPATSKRPSSVATAARLPMASAEASAGSAAGLGMLMTPTSGKVTVRTAAVRTGGVASEEKLWLR